MYQIYFNWFGTICFWMALSYASYKDIKERKVQTQTYIALFLINFIPRYINLTDSLCGMILVFLPMFIVGMIREDLGGGDIKFSALCGWILGWQYGLAALIIGCATCLITVPVLRKKGNLKNKTIPLIPYISIGCFIMSIIKLM